MTDLEQVNSAAPLSTKPRRIHSVVAGKYKVMYRPGAAFEETRLHLMQQGLVVHETSHFLFATGQENQHIILVHRLTADEVDNNIGYYLICELAPT
jgi:hypothetical protein